MKATLQLFLAAVGIAYVQAGNKLNEGDSCKVVWNGKKYMTAPSTKDCDPQQKLDCVYHVADNGDFDSGTLVGFCKNTGCYGSNSDQPPGEGTHRVTICHRTCAVKNPWVRITVDEDSWDGAGCGHKQHNVIETCNMENKSVYAWQQGFNPRDYLIKRHGTRQHVRDVLMANNPTFSASQLEAAEKDYWRYWEPACPYVRNGACCDWDRGECCGDGRHFVPKTAGIHGDPHVKRWDRKKFIWNGECDMVLVHSDHIGNDRKVLDVHVRTTITDNWSSVESAVMKVGTFKFQVDKDAIFFQDNLITNDVLPKTDNGITIAAPVTLDGMTNYTVTLTEGSYIVFSRVGPFVNVDIRGHLYDFMDAVGLIGSFDGGKPIDRTGHRVQDLDAHIAYWQVDNAKYGDPILFRGTQRAPQAPTGCRMPAANARKKRGLRDNKGLYDAAVKACEGKQDYDLCLFDVTNTGEIGLAKLHE